MSSERGRHFEAVWQARRHDQPTSLAGNLRAQKALTLLEPATRFLDVGCGDGLLAEAAMPLFQEVYGLDISPSAVAAARQRGINAQVCEAGGEVFPFEDGWFDGVAAMAVPQLVTDPGSLFRECRRVLRRGGQLLVSVPNMRAAWRLWRLAVRGDFPRTSFDPVGIDGGTLHYFTHRSLRDLLDTSGFELTRSYGIHCIPRWLEYGWEQPVLRTLKREFFSAEVLVDARAGDESQAPRRSPI